MNPLEELRARGLRVYLKDGSPRLGPVELVTEWAVRFVKEHRDAIVAQLAPATPTYPELLARAVDALGPLAASLSPEDERRIEEAARALDETAVAVVLGEVRRQHRGIAPEIDQQRTEAARLLALLQEAGERGVENGEIGDGTTGRRYSARLHDLRRAGHDIETVPLGGRRFKWIWKGYHPKEAA